MTESQVLKRLEFPAYCVRVLDNGLIAISGGGGTAKTGVGNCIELGIIDYSNELNDEITNNKPQFNSIHKFEPNDAIMKFISFSYDRSLTLNKPNRKTKNGLTDKQKQQQLNLKNDYDSTKNDLFIAAANNNSIEIYKIQPTIDKMNKTSNNLRQRNNSIRRSNSTSNQLKPNGINHSNGQTPPPETNSLKASAYLKLMNTIKLSQNKNEDDVFDNDRNLTRKSSTTTKHDEETIDTLAFCNVTSNEAANDLLLCAGTSKGSIVIWNLRIDNLNDSNNNDSHHHLNTDIKSNQIKTFKECHGKYEIDELQVNATYCHLLSIGKDNKCIIWSLKKLEKLNELDYESSFNSGANVRMKHARYANNGQTLYTTYIPRIRGGKKNINSYIQKWNCAQEDEQQTLNYKPLVKHCVKNTILTSIQSSKDGNIICCGDYEGVIYLFDSSFKTLSNFKKQHSCVVTDLAFYHDTTSSIFNSNNKLILSLSIDRTLQCYTYLDTNNTFSKRKVRSPFSLCTMNTFKLVFILIGLFLIFCYYFTHLE